MGREGDQGKEDREGLTGEKELSLGWTGNVCLCACASVCVCVGGGRVICPQQLVRSVQHWDYCLSAERSLPRPVLVGVVLAGPLAVAKPVSLPRHSLNGILKPFS